MVIRIITLNSKSIRSERKWLAFESFLDSTHPDIVCVQETNTNASPYPFARSNYDYYYNPITEEYTGTLIGVRRSLGFQVVRHEVIVDSFLQKLSLRINDKIVHLFSIYLPHSVGLAGDVLLSLKTSIRQIPVNSEFILLMGDFNCTLTPSRDRLNSRERNVQISQYLNKIIRELSLNDIWIMTQPLSARGFTFYTENSASRIDYIFCSENLRDSVISSKLITSFSDHLALSIHLSGISETPLVRTVWRFNNSLLEDENYVNSINEYLEYMKRGNIYDSVRWWEEFKRGVFELTVQYEKQKRQQDNFILKSLQRALEYSQNASIVDPFEIIRINKQVKDLYFQQSERKLSAAGVSNLIKADRPTATTLLPLLTRRTSLREVTYGGFTSNDPIKMCGMVKSYFNEIYTCQLQQPEPGSNLFDNLLQLDNPIKAQLDQPYSLLELTSALESLNKGKATGSDGLTPEFYLAFWFEIKFIFKEMVEKSLAKGILPRTVRTSIGSLLFKGGESTNLSNWRPISLMNTDYKIISKCIARRISDVIGNLVHNDQSYSVPGRSIFDSLHLYRQVISHVNKANDNVAIVSLDQRNAFDRIGHEYLFFLLKKYNFGANMIRYIKLLYREALCLFRVAGNLTSPIYLRQGIRQGCPLSGLLFILSIEPFLNLTRRSITGYRLPVFAHTDVYLKVTAYADDVNVVLADENELAKIFECYDIYARNSGAALNVAKSKGYWLGGLKGSTGAPFEMFWSSGPIKILGVEFRNDVKVVDPGSLDRLCNSLESVIKRWKGTFPSLTWRGRVIAINQFIAPKLWHSLQVLPVSDEFLKRVQTLFIKLFWCNRKHWMTEEHLCLPVSHGGLGLVHVQSKVRAFRVYFALKFLQHKETAKWYLMTEAALKRFRSANLTWQWFFTDAKPYSSSLPSFLDSVLHAVSCVNLCVEGFPQTCGGLRDIPLTVTRLLPSEMTDFSSLWFSSKLTTFGSILDGNNLKPFETITIPNYNWVLKNNLRLNYNRIVDFTESHFSTIMSTEGPENWPLNTMFRTPTGNSIYLDGSNNDRRLLLRHILLQLYETEDPLPGAWTDDPIHWKSFRVPPTLGHEGIVAFRFAKNRLADLVFLSRTGVAASADCPRCHTVGTSWHILITCAEARSLWDFVGAIKRQLCGSSLEIREIYAGFAPPYSKKVVIINYLCNLAKAVIYDSFLASIRNNTPQQDYLKVFKGKLKTRILTEYAWYVGRGDQDSFSLLWCVGEVLAKVDIDGSLNFNF